MRRARGSGFLSGKIALAAMRMIGIDDRFGESGEYLPLLEKYGISARRIEAEALTLLQGGRA